MSEYAICSGRTEGFSPQDVFNRSYPMFDFSLNLHTGEARRHLPSFQHRYSQDDIFSMIDNGIIRRVMSDDCTQYFMDEKASLAEMIAIHTETLEQLDFSQEKLSRLWESGETTFLTASKVQGLKRRLSIQAGTIAFLKSREGK